LDKSKNIKSTLGRWGLTDNEITVYLEILELGETNPYQLATKTKIPRTTVYDVILNLSLKELIELEQSDGLTKQQTRIKAKNPSVLRSKVMKKREKLYALEEELIQILPDLKGAFHSTTLPPQIKFFNGVEGVYYMEAAEKESLALSDLYSFEYDMPMDYPGMSKSNEIVDFANKKRSKTRFKAYDLMPNSHWIRHVEQYQLLRDNDYYLNREVRLVDEKLFDFASKISMTNSMVRIYSSSEDEVWGIEIHSPNLAKTLISVFRTIWMFATPLTTKEILGWGKNEILEEQRK